MGIKVALYEEELTGIDVKHTAAVCDDLRNRLTIIPNNCNLQVTISCKDVEITSPTYGVVTEFVRHIGQNGFYVVSPNDISASSRYLLKIVKVVDLNESFNSIVKPMPNTCCGCKIQGSCCGNCSFKPTYDKDGNCTNSKSSCTKGNGCCVKGCKIPKKVLENEETAKTALEKALLALSLV